MRSLKLLVFLIFFGFLALSDGLCQTVLDKPKEVTVLVSCKVESRLKVNGQQEFTLFANVVRRIFLPVGDHLLQIQGSPPCSFIIEEVIQLKESEAGRQIEKKFTPADSELSQRVFLAASDNNLEQLKQYVKCGADVNGKDENGITLLHISSKNGSLEISKFLISNGADVNIKADNDDSTPLHGAAMAGKKELVRLLLDNGAEVNAKTRPFGNTAMKIAKDFNQPKVVDVLKIFGGKLE